MRLLNDLSILAPIPAGCDTIVATGEKTVDGTTLFGKNSDREPNEAHQIIAIPAQDHKSPTVSCTYIDIPQVEHTFAVLLAKPFWIWGAEMGVNEKSVAIGNEAVFTKMPYDKKAGLIGMDFLRLALERAASAAEAVRVIVDLLEEFGQGGNCGFQHKLFYHNSFLIADPNEAWVLETAGKQWAAKKTAGLYSISNGITIENEWDMASENLVNYAVEKRWCKNSDDFNFSKCYSDFLFTTFSDSRKRRNRTMHLLSTNSGKMSIGTMMAILRDHGEDHYRPDRGLTGATVCMHASYGPVRVSQTTGSMICHLTAERPTVFVTGTAAPCTSIFKPVWIDAVPSALTGSVEGRYDASTLFWNHEVLHRQILRNYSTALSCMQDERAALEQEFIQKAKHVATQSMAERRTFSSDCFDRTLRLEDQWLKEVIERLVKKQQRFLHRRAWRRFNKKAKISTQRMHK